MPASRIPFGQFGNNVTTALCAPSQIASESGADPEEADRRIRSRPPLGKSNAELPKDVFRTVRVGSHRVEELLDQVVAGSVQNGSGPQTARLQAQPRQDEAKADHVGGDNSQTIPTGSQVVAGEDDD
jgi:hypothetical protein